MPHALPVLLCVRYLPEAYHNKTHAADVVARFSAIMYADDMFRDNSNINTCYLLAGIIAAIVHDYGHPGFNNDYMVRFRASAVVIGSCLTLAPGLSSLRKWLTGRLVL